MNAALMYCNKKFIKSLEHTRKNKLIYEAFNRLETEIKKLNYIDQINLYSATTQYLDSLNDENDSINPMEVFIIRCNSIVPMEEETLKTIGLILGVIALSLSVVILGAAIGIGIGMMLGLWQTSLIFMTSLLAAETAPLIVATASVTSGIGMGLTSGFLFFKEPGVKKALNNCIEAVKQSHLPEYLPSDHLDQITEETQQIMQEPSYDTSELQQNLTH
jgi:hypothetical protein